VGAQGAESESATPTSRNAIDSGGTPATGYSESLDRPAEGQAPPADDGVESSIGPDEADEDAGLSGFLVAEIGLAALAGVATATWLVTRRRAS
jgi:hypothetical protein